MNVIKHTSNPIPSREAANAVLADLLSSKGALFGYVDQSNRVVSFVPDANPSASVAPGQERVTLVFRETRDTPEPNAESSAFLQNLGDAMMGKGPWARNS
jgi:hypothetical protein